MLGECDCRNLAKALQDTKSIDLHVEASVLRQILELLSRDRRVNVSWIPQDENRVADRSARKRSHNTTPGTHIEDMTNKELRTLPLKDSLSVPRSRVVFASFPIDKKKGNFRQ